jgi:hypothetical protein
MKKFIMCCILIIVNCFVFAKTRYVLKLELCQTHYNLSITDYLKDKANKVEFEIPVDEDYWNSISVNESIVSDFRMGSAVLKGSLGKWKIIVKDKYIKEE